MVSGISFISSFVTRSARDEIWLITLIQPTIAIALMVIRSLVYGFFVDAKVGVDGSSNPGRNRAM